MQPRPGAGFRFAHDEAGIPVDPDLVRYGNFFVNAGYEHGLELLQRPDRPTAIFAGSDMQAMGVLRAARQLGLDVPRRPVGGGLRQPAGGGLDRRRRSPRSTSRCATWPAPRPGCCSTSPGAQPATHRIDLVTELVVRESTAPPPSES